MKIIISLLIILLLSCSNKKQELTKIQAFCIVGRGETIELEKKQFMDIDKINQSYKSFKNPKEAVKYAGELAKANREGLEQKQESTKLTSMFKK